MCIDYDKFLVSKETVVLRRWERSKQKFGFIKRVDKTKFSLTMMVDKCLDHIPLIPNEKDLLKSATDALALFANANSELPQRRRELIKPDLHDE